MTTANRSFLPYSFSLNVKGERPAGSPPVTGFASFRNTITELNIAETAVEVNILKNFQSVLVEECKIVCVKSNCADLFYAPYWGKQLKGWISNGKT